MQAIIKRLGSWITLPIFFVMDLLWGIANTVFWHSPTWLVWTGFLVITVVVPLAALPLLPRLRSGDRKAAEIVGDEDMTRGVSR